MNVEVRYFAFLREKRGIETERIETSASTVGELYEELSACYDLGLPRSAVRAAINGEFRPMNEALQEQDCVAFIPPVAGG